MSKIAIDVVLVPDKKMSDQAIDLNNQLTGNNHRKIELGEKCLPHISLCMGLVDEQNLNKVSKILADIGRQSNPLNLTASKVKVLSPVDNENFSMLDVSNTDEIKSLQQKIMSRLWPYLSYNGINAEAFVNPEEVEDISSYWVRGYAEKYNNPDTFHPHISIGVGRVNDIVKPIEFSAPTLALCHLGNYCTCRKIISSFDFGS